MDRSKGLYVTITSEDRIYKRLVTGRYQKKLRLSTLKKEIMYFAEMNYVHYAERVAEIEELADAVESDDPDRFGEMNMAFFYQMLDKVNYLIDDMEEHNLLLGTLTRTLIEDHKLDDDGSAWYVILTKKLVCECLKEILDFNFVFREIINNLCERKPIVVPNEFLYVYQEEFSQSIMLSKKLIKEYHFRSIKSYLHFLLMHFLASNPNIAWCHCCGRVFYPKTRKLTLYCDRVIENGKTCKQIGPKLKRKYDASIDKVLNTYNKTYQKMYKRYERARTYAHNLPKGITTSDFFERSDKATKARNKYLKGNLPAEEALKIIEAND